MTWLTKRSHLPESQALTDLENGGGGGIRTHGGLAPTAVFKTAALNHSATPPEAEKIAPALCPL
jgi:hypothetical protein